MEALWNLDQNLGIFDRNLVEIVIFVSASISATLFPCRQPCPKSNSMSAIFFIFGHLVYLHAGHHVQLYVGHFFFDGHCINHHATDMACQPPCRPPCPPFCRGQRERKMLREGKFEACNPGNPICSQNRYLFNQCTAVLRWYLYKVRTLENVQNCK